MELRIKITVMYLNKGELLLKTVEYESKNFVHLRF